MILTAANGWKLAIFKVWGKKDYPFQKEFWHKLNSDDKSSQNEKKKAVDHKPTISQEGPKQKKGIHFFHLNSPGDHLSHS